MRRRVIPGNGGPTAVVGLLTAAVEGRWRWPFDRALFVCERCGEARPPNRMRWYTPPAEGPFLRCNQRPCRLDGGRRLDAWLAEKYAARTAAAAARSGRRRDAEGRYAGSAHVRCADCGPRSTVLPRESAHKRRDPVTGQASFYCAMHAPYYPDPAALARAAAPPEAAVPGRPT